MRMEGQGPYESEDIQLVIAKAVTCNRRIPKEGTAIFIDKMHHVRWDHRVCAPSLL